MDLPFDVLASKLHNTWLLSRLRNPLVMEQFRAVNSGSNPFESWIGEYRERSKINLITNRSFPQRFFCPSSSKKVAPHLRTPFAWRDTNLKLFVYGNVIGVPATRVSIVNHFWYLFPFHACIVAKQPPGWFLAFFASRTVSRSSMAGAACFCSFSPHFLMKVRLSPCFSMVVSTIHRRTLSCSSHRQEMIGRRLGPRLQWQHP